MSGCPAADIRGGFYRKRFAAPAVEIKIAVWEEVGQDRFDFVGLGVSRLVKNPTR